MGRSDPGRARRTAPVLLLLLLLCGTVGLSACSSAENAQSPVDRTEADADDGGPNDPLEPLNRAVFAFNLELDRFVLRPVTLVYRTVIPKPLRSALGNFLSNLGEPLNAIHGALQGDARAVEHGVGRFLVNTVLGLGGLIDVADEIGLEKESRSFGQTLGTWGVGQGAYLVLPVFGPSSLRDAPAGFVDRFISPQEQLTERTSEPSKWQLYGVVAGAVDFRDRNFEQLDAFLGTTLDPYVAARSAYLQLTGARGGPDEDPFADDMFLDIDDSDLVDEEELFLEDE